MRIIPETVIIKHKNKEHDKMIFNSDPDTLHTLLTEIQEKTTPPHSISSLMASMRCKGHSVNRADLTIDLLVLRNLKIIEYDVNTWHQKAIKPLYTKVNAHKNKEGRTVVKLE